MTGPVMTGAGLRKRRRLRLIGLAAITLALGTALIGYAMRDGIAFFRSPSQVLAAPPPPHERFRLGGMVAAGSLSRQGDLAQFDIEDGRARIAVAYRGILPDLFSEGEGTVATGHYRNGIFVADEVLAKHDETYMPREVAAVLGAASDP